MSYLSKGNTIEEIIALIPASTELFEKMGIDYCCGGKLTLESVCAIRKIAPEEIIRILKEEKKMNDENGIENSIENLSLSELTEHIEKVHHAWLWGELEKLDSLTEKVAKVHGSGDSRLWEVRQYFRDLSQELSDHMLKEEKILFPLIRQIEDSRGAIVSHCGSVTNPISQMNLDHDQAEVLLAKIRKLCDDFIPPPNACFSYRSMLAGLSKVESDLREHVYKESVILFPKIIFLEKSKLADEFA